MSDINNKVISATKWSSITELLAKIITPLSTIVLARLLTPEDFGVLLTATMVISFAEIFTDAGFQKYLIQKQFQDVNTLYRYTNVAFWANLIMSMVIWLVIALFCEKIAVLVGNPGRGDVIAVSCICIPLAAFSSIQMALYKRFLDFKTLFIVRIIGLCIPIVITIPLALVTRSYWSLIVGMISLNLSNAILLTLKSKWKPNLFFKKRVFNDMFSFSFWSMIEAISVWLTNYLDMFIVGVMLSTYYVGLYRTSITVVGMIMGLITSATTPVLFSTLSKLQDSDQEFKKMFFQFQKIVGLLIVPIGFGIFLFRDFITNVALGEQWMESADFIGYWGLTSSFSIVLSHYCSEVYRAKGKPKLSVLAQVLHIIFMVPLVYWAVGYGFDFLCEVRSLARLQLILVNVIILYLLTKISIKDMLKNIFVPLLGSMSMFVVLILPFSEKIIINILYILLCICLYCIVITRFKDERHIIMNLRTILRNKNR